MNSQFFLAKYQRLVGKLSTAIWTAISQGNAGLPHCFYTAKTPIAFTADAFAKENHTLATPRLRDGSDGGRIARRAIPRHLA
jgi:hypothetical protein